MEIISNNKTEINTVEVEFKINPEDFEVAVQAAFLKRRKNIAVPGFRKGKATRKMIESNYGEGVFYEDAVNDIYKTSVPGVIDELKLDIVDAPEVEVLSVGKDEGVTFRAVFTVKPEVTVGDYKGIEVELEPKEISDDDINEQLDRIRSDNARIFDVSDRAVINGDTVTFDFAGFCEGEAFEGGSAKGFKLEIGSGRFIPGFEEQIIDKNIGEDFDVNVTFPEEYPSEKVAGKDATFKCKISEIAAKQLAELDDEFVKDISEFDTLDELKEDIRSKIADNNEKLRDADIERELAEKIIASLEGDIPQVMFEDRIDEMVRDWGFKYNTNPADFAQRSGMTPEMFREGFRETSEKQVKFRLALEKIAELENFAVSEEELEAEYEKMSTQYKMEIDKVRNIIAPNAVTSDIKTEKALKMIKESAKVTNKEKT
ncbi:MAG: trigger factor [Oscillospiraceae bacterium]|nr:trigger factor [Oscillospiraceae bacterium]